MQKSSKPKADYGDDYDDFSSEAAGVEFAEQKRKKEAAERNKAAAAAGGGGGAGRPSQGGPGSGSGGGRGGRRRQPGGFNIDDDTLDVDDDQRGGSSNDQGNKSKVYMLFDFRRGSSQWPMNCEIVTQEQASELIQKKKDAAHAAEAASAKKDDGGKDKEAAAMKGNESRRGGGDGDDAWGENYGTATRTGILNVATSSTVSFGPAVGDSYYNYGENVESDDDEEAKVGAAGEAGDEEDKDAIAAPPPKVSIAPNGAQFETLNDGATTALIIQQGCRLKLNIADLLKGGDATKAQREEDEKKKEKARAKNKGADYWGAWGNKNKKWFKETASDWTVTVDLKVNDPIPSDGIALLHTALIHSEESKGRTKLTPTEGEAVVNSEGGVGNFGTFGTPTIEQSKWHRVVVSVKIGSGENKQGELRTWIDGEPACICKSEAIGGVGGRFELDMENLFLFSSSNPAMMPGNVSVRTIRVENHFADDNEVKEMNMFERIAPTVEEARARKVDEQRKGLSLASIHAKPRPMWMNPVLVGTFGDAFTEGTGLVGKGLLAWTYEVINYSLQKMLRNKSLLDIYFTGLTSKDKAIVSDVMYVLSKSATTFKHMAKMLEGNADGTALLSFLRKVKKAIGNCKEVGDILLLPGIVEKAEVLLILVRKSERFFDLVVVQTDPKMGLRYHAVDASIQPPDILFRTCMVVNDVEKKMMMDDVFWMAFYRLSITPNKGDMSRFYDILIPFITGKPLEQTLIATERGEGNKGPWRHAQKSSTAYVRCIFEAINYLLLFRGTSQSVSDQVHLAFQAQLMTMLDNDLHFINPDENGRLVCEMVLSGFSDSVVRVSSQALVERGEDAFGNVVPQAARASILELERALNESSSITLSLPPNLDLEVELRDNASSSSISASDVGGKKDPSHVQFMDHWCWDTEPNAPDPGLASELRKYDPVNLLRIPEKARTRDEAFHAMRVCLQECTKIDNQSHCIKNTKHLIASMIEHLFTQVVSVPKPRARNDMNEKRLARIKLAKEKQAAREMKEKNEKDERTKAWSSFKGKASSVAAKADLFSQSSSSANENAMDSSSSLEVGMDRSAGELCEFESTSEPCYWDEDISYSMQVECLQTLSCLQEMFTAAALSIQHNRSFDGVCIVVHGVVAAISDAIIRRLATDDPSPISAIMMGCTVDGRALGFAGFGASISSFAEQAETIEIHYPELAVAKTAVIDYFSSPSQQTLDKIFDWEVEYLMKPTRNLIKFVRHICVSIAMVYPQYHKLLLDSFPESSLLLRTFPELRAYRDAITHWKWFLNADISIFPNYSDPQGPAKELSSWDRLYGQMKYSWDDQTMSYQVSVGPINRIFCRPDPDKVDPITGRPIPLEQIPRNRYPSTATPTFYLTSKPAVKTEDDVIYRPNLPSFDEGQGQILSQRDSELLFSFLTVPYLRLPLILTFFASDDRVHKLQSQKLKDILDSVLFEPGRHLKVSDTGVSPVMVPTLHPELLSTSFGLLMNELHSAPHNVIGPILSLIDGAKALDTGSVSDVGESDFNTGVNIILYIMRLGSRVENYLSFLIDWKQGRHRTIDSKLREINISDECLLELIAGRNALRERLIGYSASISTGSSSPGVKSMINLIQDYLLKLDNESKALKSNEKLINLFTKFACDFHAHILLTLRSIDEVDITVANVKVMLGSFIYLTTRHTWNKATRELGRLLVPETELYEILTVTRRRLMNWGELKKQSQLNIVLQTSLQVSSSNTGSIHSSSLDKNNRWAVIGGRHSVGRYAIASSNFASSNVTDEEPVEIIADTGVVGVEMDIQLGQMTLRSKHLEALETAIANHEDVRLIFGTATMQASLLERSEHRRRYRLVGLGHELEYWNSPHTSYPPLAAHLERNYDPAELGEDEGWISDIFEPVRLSFFDGPQPPSMQFMLPEKHLPRDAETAMLVGLHQYLGGPYKIVMLYRRLKCVQIFDCVSQGRQWWYTLTMTTDVRFALREMQHSFDDRQKPYPKWWFYGSGQPYKHYNAQFVNNDMTSASPSSTSILIKRDATDKRNFSGGEETFVPERFLLGVIPQSLLDDFLFWQDEAVEPSWVLNTGEGGFYYKRLRGYPRDEKNEHVLIVEFQNLGNWDEGMSSEAGPKNYLESTLLPGTSIRVTRCMKADLIEAVNSRKYVAQELEKLIASNVNFLNKFSSARNNNKKTVVSKRSTEKSAFSVGDVVEFDSDGTGKKWTGAEILKVHNGGEKYDISPSEAWVGGKQMKVPSVFLRKQKTRSIMDTIIHASKFEGLSDSEEEDWRDDDSSIKKQSDSSSSSDRGVSLLPFEVFDRLDYLLDVTAWDHERCSTILRNMAKESFVSINQLANAMKAEIDSFPELKAAIVSRKEAIPPSRNMILLNLLGAPRHSRLHSLGKTLTRIENLGFILAWTKASSMKLDFALGSAVYGCPDLDLVELPRLKLSFSARRDFNGELRLYSLDHSDLFITNERHPFVNKMLQGIPHSLLLSNLKGELQVIVPIVNPKRPIVSTLPFTTSIVLDRSDLNWFASLKGTRYYMYPVHVSSTFLLTKGINSALYLMLLRFLHREYDSVYRLADSVATDSELNSEGDCIFQALKGAEKDFHPDAHACRLKISLVTLDAGIPLPWDLTVQLSKYVIKLESVAATCILSAEEELQLLVTKQIVLKDDHKMYKEDLHDPYTIAVVQNRLNSIKAAIDNKSECDCVNPPRAASNGWPYYQDNTIFGEKYNSLTEISGQEDWTAMLEGPKLPGPETSFGRWNALVNFAASRANTATDSQVSEPVSESKVDLEEEVEGLQSAAGGGGSSTVSGLSSPVVEFDADFASHPFYAEMEQTTEGVAGWAVKDDKLGHPPGGFLSLVYFTVLWDPRSLAVYPKIEEIAPSFPAVRFFTARADRLDVVSISRSLRIKRFPTVLIFRGSKEVCRLTGLNCDATKVSDSLKRLITKEDVAVHKARVFADQEANPVQVEEDEDENLQWTWDPEYAARHIKTFNYGNAVAYIKQSDDDDIANSKAQWQFSDGSSRNGNNDNDETDEGWVDFESDMQLLLEREYRSGSLYYDTKFTVYSNKDAVCVQRTAKHKVSARIVTGLTSTFSSTNEEFICRRKGPRFQVKGDDMFTTEQQKVNDKYEFEKKAAMKAQQAAISKRNQGRDVEGIRGTNAFIEETGLYEWSCVWNHEPGRNGTCDSVGICAEVADNFGLYQGFITPLLGCKGAVSLGLYADGNMYFDGKIICRLSGPPRKSSTMDTFSQQADSSSMQDLEESEDAKEDTNVPKCSNKHKYLSIVPGQTIPRAYCSECMARDEQKLKFCCNFCQVSLCTDCYDKKRKKLEESAKGISSDISKVSKDWKGKNSIIVKKSFQAKAREIDSAVEDSWVDKAFNDATEMADNKRKGGSDSSASTSSATVRDDDSDCQSDDDDEDHDEDDDVDAGGAGDECCDFAHLITQLKALESKVLTKKKGELDDFIPPENMEPTAVLFGRGSRVTLKLNTAEGGSISFEVDGVPLKSEEGVTSFKPNDKGLFELMGTDKLYPCLCMCPLDELPPLKESEGPLASMGGAMASGVGSGGGGGGGKGDDKPDKADAEKERKKVEMREIAELAQKCRRSYEDISKLTAQQRSKLALLINTTLKRRVPNVGLIIGNGDAPALKKPSQEQSEQKEADTEEADKKTSASNAAVAAVAGDSSTSASTSEVLKEAKKGDSDKPEDQQVSKDNNAADSNPFADVPIDRIVWMFESSDGWTIHTREVSSQLEETLRAGKTEIRMTIGEKRWTIRLVKGSDGKGPCQLEDENPSPLRLRRHVIGEGLQGEWEMLSLKFAPPITMVGQSALGVLDRLWDESETMGGQENGLGFLFLYSMLIGQMRVVCISSGGYGIDYSRNDSHRFAYLVTQLYKDSKKRSLLSSCVNVLGRNRHLCVQMPRLFDNRVARNSNVFNGWTDENEPRSPVAELFKKLVPTLQKLNRDKFNRMIRRPPPPPYPEFPVTVGTCKPVVLSRPRATLSNTACSSMVAKPISRYEIEDLATQLKITLGAKGGMDGQPPHEIIDLEDFNNVSKLAALGHDLGKPRLLILRFGSPSCPYCEQLDPFFHFLSLKYGNIFIFANICVDDNKPLCRKYSIRPIPATILVRGNDVNNVLGKIEGGGAKYPDELFKLVQKHATEDELELIKSVIVTSISDKEQIASYSAISINEATLAELTTAPLSQLSDRYVIRSLRTERGLSAVQSDTAALDLVGGHESAETAVAKSMLTRMKADVKAYATAANTVKSPKIVGLGDSELLAFFEGGSVDPIRDVRTNVDNLLKDLIELRKKDSKSIDDCIPLLTRCSNFVEPNDYPDGSSKRKDRVNFTLRRYARQVPFVWNEFLFGSTLSTEREADLRGLNPFIEPNVLEITQRLLIVTMLRANRVGHTNRCIGSAISLLELLDKALASPVSSRKKDGETLIPRLTQASGDLGEGLDSRRHFVNSDSSNLQFDPRFLIFEFVWNLLLRKMQVVTVTNFIASLGRGDSTVKQMIMGAGKTTVVAPLLALMLADGDSLILSVVPKALLEMSRKQMRETFSSIICKRIYTLQFDRSSEVTSSISQSLTNAKKNRGVIVATPTTIKAFQLVYTETILLLEEAKKLSLSDKIAPLKTKLVELRSILATFRDSILLLDEVDLVLHPLKSELNFPIGEKFALEGSDHGERWNLPMHLVDAIFFDQTGRITTFESTGAALEIVTKLSKAIQTGYDDRRLQRLPHFTLLDINFYNEHLKPILADWAYLWLQKQHLHGIDKKDAIEYILEGAVARTDLALKVKMLQSAVDKLAEIDDPELTPGTKGRLVLKNLRETSLVRQASFNPDEDSTVTDDKKRESLEKARDIAELQRRLISDIFSVENELEAHLKKVHKRSVELSKEAFALKQEIDVLNCPRDDSLDNDTIIWVSVEFLGGASFEDISGSGTQSSATSVLTIADSMEEKGFKVKRIGDAIEAIKRARELKENRRLRAVIYGGGEAAQGCGPTCNESHGQNLCLVCRKSYGVHGGHNCRDGKRGSWRIGKGSVDGDKKLNLNAPEFFRLLTDMDDKSKENGTVPEDRCVLYGGNTVCKDDLRAKLWGLKVNLLELPEDMLKFVDSRKAWEDVASAEGAEETKLDDDIDNKIIIRLDECTARLADVEDAQSKLIDDDEEERKKLGNRKKDLYSQLNESVVERKAQLDHTKERLADILNSGGVEVPDIASENPVKSVYFSGPRSGRDAALAEAWLDGLTFDARVIPSAKTIRRAQRALKWISCEYESLRQVKLAAKVVALIPSPEHIKYLNLTHDWLRTFLPHCLQKVNRVSFGLLSTKECTEVLLDDPNMPRSRLALAVPFIGKDVPSKSSEFAHPDITIGLTIMAYRYSGLRQNDFNDLIDHITVSYKNEIGAPRERASSIRYESWVAASGGMVRGIDMSKITGITGTAVASSTSSSSSAKVAGGGSSSSSSAAGGGVLTLADKERMRADADLEVVQLKFLQKSNKEQIVKIQNLWSSEPLALHYYLNKFIFPEHMRTQVKKLHASGQSVGGDMIVGRRVGFSGTPSDLLPLELGKCQYETGDDGKMLTTVLDPSVVSYEMLIDNWRVESLLDRLATSENPRFNALIDAGALITGYSNEQVAAELLKRGLPWCEGVIFLDSDDKQQVLIRATNRIISADQCGVPLDKRFAFYDQIHTTGIDIKHVVNATAVITLGKDNVFRDYVQGAFRMRGIGNGQKIHVFVIPEVKELIEQTKAAARSSRTEEEGDHTTTSATSASAGSISTNQDAFPAPHEDLMSDRLLDINLSSNGTGADNSRIIVDASSTSTELVSTSTKPNDSVLKDIVAWLVVQSMKSEQTQWSMLCIQNISNLYRKPAFDVLLQSAPILSSEGSLDAPLDALSAEKRLHLTPKSALAVFEEDIDFSLEATVPDPTPFMTKLENMLLENQAFILTEKAESDAKAVLEDVGQHSMEEGGANKLETEQEREQEQEQQKEVQARRDQQIEIEKFVDREYSRNEEKPTPWHIGALLHSPDSADHPFYPLRCFALRHQEPVTMPSQMFCSKNYFNPNWTGLRRIKNVIMVMEWAHSIDELRLLTSEEYATQKVSMNCERMISFEKSFKMLSQGKEFLTRQEFELLVRAMTDSMPSEQDISNLLENENEQQLSFERIVSLFQSGRIHPANSGRHYVAVSLAEAETLRRILHVKRDTPLIGKAQVSLRYSPLPSKGSIKAGDGGVVFDSTKAWKKGTGATRSEAATIHNAFRYFDGDMHFCEDGLSALIRGLQKSTPSDREKFFATTVGVRRRLERKWQETPLSKAFTLADDLAMLKQRAQAIFIREALKKIGMKKWEAFMAFQQSDNNGMISAAAMFGALKYLNMPGVDANEVLDFMEANDMNRDHCLDYKEFSDAIADIDRMNGDDDDDDDDVNIRGENEEKNEKDDDIAALATTKVTSSKTQSKDIKIEPFGTEEIRKVIIRRMKEEVERQKIDRARRDAMASEMDFKIFEEELKTQQGTLGATNPSRLFINSGGGFNSTEYKFTSNSNPLRTRFATLAGASSTGKFKVMNEEKIRGKVKKHVMRCPNNHTFRALGYIISWTKCSKCKGPGVSRQCEYSKSKTYSTCHSSCYQICDRCIRNDEEDRMKAALSPSKNETYMSLEPGISASLQLRGNNAAGPFTVSTTATATAAAGESSPVASAAGGGGVSTTVTGGSGTIAATSFTIVAEIMLPSLPKSGQRAALIRFSPPPSQATAKMDKRQMLASMYVNSKGEVGGPDLLVATSMSTTASVVTADVGVSTATANQAIGSQSTSPSLPPLTQQQPSSSSERGDGDEGDKTFEKLNNTSISTTKNIKPKCWTTIAACVTAGKVTTFYIDGVYVSSYDNGTASNDNSEGSLMKLGPRIILFGGGREAEAGGGCVRKVWVIDGALRQEDVEVYNAENHLFNSSIVRIQSTMRMKLARIKVVTMKEDRDGTTGSSKEKSSNRAAGGEGGRGSQGRGGGVSTNPGTMTFFFKIFIPSSRELKQYMLSNIDPSRTTIEDLKEKMFDLCGISSNNIRSIIYAGRTLDDSRLISDYGIQKESTFNVLTRGF